ncbi:hypothetical protein [Chryseobacterium indologenes]|uniref:Uncharacterized protein n=1 Tax=Chryseobacterium indologenes TaxID=253 RepID=A0A0N0ITP8_CHRID|nr:hypothetical protein [Chryseobacterium indologenes]KPE48951.1 hypothetical protein AOB46_22645 [Chryseobacterium indologenes]
MSIKKLYYYFYYKIHKSIAVTSEVSGGKFGTLFKTSLVIIVLEIWLLASLLIYYKVYINPKADIVGTKIGWIIMVAILVLVDYAIFYSKNQWKKIIDEFDKLPNKKNKKGNWVTFTIVLIIIGNFIFSFYCLDLKARKDQTGPYSKKYIEFQKER